jgi:hypothetical protein
MIAVVCYVALFLLSIAILEYWFVEYFYNT